METIHLKTIKDMLESNDIFKLYDVDMDEIVSGIYKSLMGDSEFVSQVRCRLNSISDIYYIYKQKVEALVLNLIDIETGDQCMLKYNLMRDDFTFYDRWRRELFNVICQDIRKNEAS